MSDTIFLSVVEILNWKTLPSRAVKLLTASQKLKGNWFCYSECFIHIHSLLLTLAHEFSVTLIVVPCGFGKPRPWEPALLLICLLFWFTWQRKTNCCLKRGAGRIKSWEQCPFAMTRWARGNKVFRWWRGKFCVKATNALLQFIVLWSHFRFLAQGCVMWK